MFLYFVKERKGMLVLVLTSIRKEKTLLVDSLLRVMANSSFSKSLLVTIFTLSLFAKKDVRTDRARRVIGGEDAKAGEFPYQVYLRYNGVYICGGAIISDRHVLSAAHCVCELIDSPYEELTVVTGAIHTTHPTQGTEHTVKTVDCHPGFRFGFEYSWRYDVIVITLNGSLSLNSSVSAIPLPTADTDANVTAVLSGWGRTGMHTTCSRDLQKLTVATMTNSDCQKYYKNKILRTQICTRGVQWTGAYKGDSGSPLVSNGVLVGVFSWTMQDAYDYPGVYTRVYRIISFIRRSMEERARNFCR